MTTGRAARGLSIALIALAAAAAVRLLAVRTLDGAVELGFPGGAIGDIRLSCVLVAATAGGVLGAAGWILQALLRNPLASPFVLGVTGGAGTGVAVAAVLAALAGAAAPGPVAMVVPSAIGAVGALAAVVALGRRNGAIDPLSLVLAGVIVGTVAAGLTTVAESLLPPDRRGLLAGWLFGRIPEAPDRALLAACAAAALALAGAGAVLGPRLDAATLSDDEARSVGINLGRLRTSLFVACGVATAMTVALCGPVAFIGLVAPHCARGLVGAGSRAGVPTAAACGAALLVAADALRQWIDLGAGRLPLGAVTAVLGGVAFLVLLRRTAAGWFA